MWCFHFTKTKIIATSSPGSGPSSYPGYYLRSPPASGRFALVSIYQTDVTSFSKMEEVLNGYLTNPNPTPTLTPNPNRNPNSINPNQINKKIQKETTLKTDQRRNVSLVDGN